jgi:hypothetical protein
MIDENAFGILIGYFSIEDDEYGLERRQFVEAFGRFRSTIYDYVVEALPASEARALDLGLAVFFEFAVGEQLTDTIGWARALRA